MIVCHCQRVTDRTIREIARDGALTREQVASRCGAGSCCGGCRPAIDEILSEEVPCASVVRLPVVFRESA